MAAHDYRGARVPYVVGVDTHAKNHVFAILAAATGALVDEGTFPTTPAGMARAIEWVAHRTGADLAVLWVIEGVASYGALLAGRVTTACYPIIEAARMDARSNHGVGKSDPLDARRIAAAVLRLDLAQLRHPRADQGIRAALRVLVAARDHMTAERTAAVNALTALLRVVDLGVDARKPLTGGAQVREVAHWRTRPGEEIGAATARAEAVRLAKQTASLDAKLTANKTRINELVAASPAAPLLDKTGIGPVTAAIVLTAWSHHGRIRSKAAFAAWPESTPSPRHWETQSVTGSAKADTVGSTVPCTPPWSPAWSTTPTLAPTPRNDEPKAATAARSATVSSATSPATSTEPSTPPPI